MKSSEIAAALGVVMLGAGVFAPVISGPLLGSINLFGNGEDAGLHILIAAVVAALALAANGLWLAVLVGAACLVLIGFELMDAMNRLQRAQASMANEGAIGRVIANTFSLQWGWLLLIGGAASLLGGALFQAMGEDDDATTATPPPRGADDDYVSIDEFARAINRSPAQVLKGIKAGVLVGRFNGSEWQVHRSSLPRKSGGD